VPRLAAVFLEICATRRKTMRTKLMLGAALAILLAAASVPLAFAGGDKDRHGHHHGHHVRIIDLTTTVLQDADVDLGDPGPSVGDRFVFSDTVFRDGEEVGIDGGECVIVQFTPGADPEGEPEAATAQCVATVSLPEGQITAQGLVDFTTTDPFTIAITGGTGKYRTAHGEVEVSEESEEVDRLRLKVIL
jgi:hypothetical protein